MQQNSNEVHIAVNGHLYEGYRILTASTDYQTVVDFCCQKVFQAQNEEEEYRLSLLRDGKNDEAEEITDWKKHEEKDHWSNEHEYYKIITKKLI